MGNLIVLHPRDPEPRIVDLANSLSRAHRRMLALLLDDALRVGHADVVQLVAELEIALLVYPAGPSRWKLTPDGRAVMSLYLAQARRVLGPQPLARNDSAARALLEELGLREPDANGAALMRA